MNVRYKIQATRYNALRAGVCFLFFVSCILLPKGALAQSLTLSITPPLAEVVIKPGKSVVIAYTISNLGDPVVVSADIRPFSPIGNTGQLVIKEEFSGPIRFNLENSNIKLQQPFSLSNQEGQQLVLKIRVPEGTPEGDYYYTFFATTETDKQIEGIASSQTVSRIGSNILITVTQTGKVDIKGSIGQFMIKPRYSFSFLSKRFNIIESSDKVPVQLLINNSGLNVLKPHGAIILNGNFGERAEYNLLAENVLSNSSRLIHATPSANITSGDSSLVLSGFFIGKYTLTTNVDFGLGTDSKTQTLIFYGIPVKLLIALAVACVGGVILIKKVNKED